MTLDLERRPFVREAGAGPAVICIHSSASSSAQWRPLMESLAGRHRILAADLYGSGKSPAWPADRALSLHDEVELLDPVFRSAGDGLHLIGHSYGGAVALKAALRHRERIESLVLVEPVLFSVLLAVDPDLPSAREIVALAEATIADVDRGDLARAAERFVDYWTPGAWAGLSDAQRRALSSAVVKVKAEWHALFTEPATLAALSRIDVSTTLIVGADSPASSRGVARLLALALPRVTVVELSGAGHMAAITQPGRVNAVIAEHLDRVRGTRRSHRPDPSRSATGTGP